MCQEKKNRKLIIGLFIGLVFGFGAGLLIGGIFGRELQAGGYFGENGTTFYEATRDIQLENGSTISAGSKLRLDRQMPEGFTRLTLTVNTEETDAFSVDDSGRPHEVAPYWTIGRAQQDEALKP